MYLFILQFDLIYKSNSPMPLALINTSFRFSQQICQEPLWMSNILSRLNEKHYIKKHCVLSILATIVLHLVTFFCRFGFRPLFLLSLVCYHLVAVMIKVECSHGLNFCFSSDDVQFTRTLFFYSAAKLFVLMWQMLAPDATSHFISWA